MKLGPGKILTAKKTRKTLFVCHTGLLAFLLRDVNSAADGNTETIQKSFARVALVCSVDVDGEYGVRATTLCVHGRRRSRSHASAICQTLQHLNWTSNDALG